MIERYTTKTMKELWCDETKFSKWLLVEIAVLEGWVKRGDVKKSVLERVKKKARFSVKRIEKIEKTVKHDVIAFLTNVAENVGEDARFIHMGMTSSDVLDTANALLLRDAGNEILKDLISIEKTLKKLAVKYKRTIMMGRTHGIHAEPITLGLKFLLWYDEARRSEKRLLDAITNISYAKISGAVGTFSTIPPEVSEYAAKKLKLRLSYAASQVISRDRHAEFLLTLSLIAGFIEKIALEIRHLQRTEVGEVMEPFTKGQKGSSAMPHKRNPILCERLCGLSRLIRSNVIVALENIPLWHERDISHSSCERVMFPDVTTVLDYSFEKILFILNNLDVDEEHIKNNLNLTKGLIFSQRVLLKLIEKGISREQAYKIVQSNAKKVWKNEEKFFDILLKDKIVKRLLTMKELQSCFDLNYYLKNIDYIYGKVIVDN